MILFNQGLKFLGEFVTRQTLEFVKKKKEEERPMVFRVEEGIEKAPTQLPPGPTPELLRALKARAPVEFVSPDETGKRIAPKISEFQKAREEVTKKPLITVEKKEPLPLTLGKAILRAPARALTSIGIEPAAGVTALFIGGKIEPVFTPKTKLQRIVFGDEPVVGVFKQVENSQQNFVNVAKALHLNEDMALGSSFVLSPLIVGGFVGLDLTPFGPLERNLARTIARETDGAKILSLLKKSFRNPEDELRPVAEALRFIKDPKEVQKALQNISSTLPTKPPDELLNFERLKLNDEETRALKTIVDAKTDRILDAKGNPLSFKEVQRAAREAAEDGKVLGQVISREESKKIAAIDLQAREQLVRSDKIITSKNASREEKEAAFNDLIAAMDVTTSIGTDAARRLSLRRQVAEDSVSLRILKRLRKEGKKLEDIKEQAFNVDWNDPKKVTEFYRSQVKPTFWDILEEYRYNNMLSNPRTFERNLFSNIFSTAFVRPLTHTVEAGIDLVQYVATKGRIPRDKKFLDIPRYYRDTWKAVPNAWGDFQAAWREESAVTLSDLEHFIPTGKLPKFFRIPTRALEATDRFLMRIISDAEQSRLIRGGTSEEEAGKKASELARYSLFRQGLDPANKTGQGLLLSKIDRGIEIIDEARNAGVGLKWFVPFLRTPMNFAKQWIEFSPVGLAILPGAARKKEVLAKVLIGSTLTAWGGKLALEDRTTWGVPKDKTQRELFFASGKRPYAVKIGDSWVPMMYLGPLAYSLALPAAIKNAYLDDPGALTDSNLNKLTKSIFSLSEFLSQQTFMEGLGNYIEMFSGQEEFNMDKILAFTGGQIIPWQGMVRYISTLVDPVFRQADSFTEAVQRDLPYLSTKLDPYLLPTGEFSERNISSYVAPYDIKKEREEYNALLKIREEQLQINRLLAQNDKDVNQKALQIVNLIKEGKTQEEMDSIKKQLEENPELEATVSAMIKKQAFYLQSTLQPLYYLKDKPTDIAEIIYARFILSKTDKEIQERVVDFIQELKEYDLWNEKVREKLQNLVEEEALQGALE